MSSLWMMVKEGGFGALVALFLGVVGLIVAIGAGVTAVASRRAAFYVGIAALVLASLASGVGLLGMAMGWRNTQAAVAGATVDAVQRYRIVREGYFESQSSAKIGFGASVLPLLLGAAAALVGAGANANLAQPGAGYSNVKWGTPWLYVDVTWFNMTSMYNQSAYYIRYIVEGPKGTAYY